MRSDPAQYLQKLAGVIERGLGNQLRGVYLTGSAARGSYVRGRSDLDVLVAVAEAAPDAIDALASSCSHEALPVPATKLELVVYELEALADPGENPRWSLNLNTGPGIAHAGRDPSREPAHWFVLDLAFARRHAEPLRGPAPVTLIGAIPDAAIERAFVQLIEWYEHNEPAGVSTARARAEAWFATRSFIAKPGMPPGGADG